MVIVKGNRVSFTGKDAKQMSRLSKDLGLSIQDTFTGMLWELVMLMAREGKF